MVHLYYHLNDRGISHAAAVCAHAAAEIKATFGIDPCLCLRNWTASYPIWAGANTSEIYLSKGKLATRHQKAQATIYLELGGINGANSFSIRKLTDWCDRGEKEKMVDAVNKSMSDFIEQNEYHCPTGATDDGMGMTYSIQEMVENSMAAGATKISINTHSQ